MLSLFEPSDVTQFIESTSYTCTHGPNSIPYFLLSPTEPLDVTQFVESTSLNCISQYIGTILCTPPTAYETLESLHTMVPPVRRA